MYNLSDVAVIYTLFFGVVLLIGIIKDKYKWRD
jgi:hypothetical protein